MLTGLRWLKGYIIIAVQKPYAAKLMSICLRNGILLWDGEEKNDIFYGKINKKYYLQLSALADKIHLEIKLINEFGLPSLLHKYHKRIGILMGIIIFIIGLITSQQFIWKIEIEGCKNTNPNELIELLADAGVHKGSLKSKINLRHVAREILIKDDTLSWTTLNLHGTTAILRIRERIIGMPKIDTNVPANVVANQDAQIKRLEITDGKPILKVGDTVRKGEIIVSGVWQDRWGLTHFMRAGAKVFAYIPKSIIVKIPLVIENQKISEEQALIIAQKELIKQELQFEENTIISRNIWATLENQVLIMHGDYQIEQDIALQKDLILLEYNTKDAKLKIPKENGY